MSDNHLFTLRHISKDNVAKIPPHGVNEEVMTEIPAVYNPVQALIL